MHTHNRYLTIVAALAASLLPALSAAEERTIDVETEVSVGAETSRTSKVENRKPVTFLGLEVTPASGALAAQLRLPEGQGLVVRFVVPDSPAQEAGLQEHDVLLRLDDQILIDPKQLSVLVRSMKDGGTVTLTYLRAGAESKAKATLASREMPDKAYRWREQGAPHGMPFEGDFHNILPEDFSERMREFEERMENLHIDIEPPLPGEPHIMIFRPKTNIVLSDEAGELRLKTMDGNRMLIARDAEGQEVFSGPIDTKEQRAALPPGLRRRLEKLENMEIVPPEPPIPPVPMIFGQPDAVTL